MFNILILIICGISLFLGLLTGFNYLTHPLCNTNLIKYTGGKFWLVSLITLLIYTYRIS